ncbi:MAG: hypothetical protein CBE49_000105 [Rickettsiales bacterium TMED289]|nr:MAG: hypothetical protein CBE49_000105 [Rickettsiales bacterium TMED289]|tara:strand:- start:2082 stop:2990 length:909 start_codon:yes stop_codon:yes gene_type:complete
MKKKYNKIWRNTGKYNTCLPPNLPSEKIVTKDSKVCAMGSCFADEMGWWLRSNGVNVGDHGEVDELQHLLYRWGTFFNPKNLSDCLDRVINDGWEIEDKNFAYIEKEDTYYNLFMKVRGNSNNLETVKQKLLDVENYWKNWLDQSDVIIITLGLIEAWIDKSNGKAWQAFVGNVLSGKSYNDLADFKVLSYEECLKEVKKSIDLISNFGVDKKFIITLSPIPLEFTFRDQDIVTANRISKSTLRVVAEKVCEQYDNVYYFPSFEIVMDCVGPTAFKEDLRHVRPEVFSEIIAPQFLESFGDF